jgi:hypothetical protein
LVTRENLRNHKFQGETVVEHLNRYRLKTRNTANLALVILAFLVLGCSCQKFAEMLTNKAAKGPPPSSQTNSPSSPPSPPDDGSNSGEYDLTMAKYDQIKIGTPRSEVERILGGKGTEISSSSGGGMRFSVNKWEGSDFKSIILSFKNDKVMTRSQVGLK